MSCDLAVWEGEHRRTIRPAATEFQLRYDHPTLAVRYGWREHVV